jgi:broad specificity phosphatase PhoE
VVGRSVNLAEVKIVHFIRHGEAEHNVAARLHGRQEYRKVTRPPTPPPPPSSLPLPPSPLSVDPLSVRGRLICGGGWWVVVVVVVVQWDFLDAPLTDKGRDQARAARTVLLPHMKPQVPSARRVRLQHTCVLCLCRSCSALTGRVNDDDDWRSRDQVVLVSPLTRTLQTAEEIFQPLTDEVPPTSCACAVGGSVSHVTLTHVASWTGHRRGRRSIFNMPKQLLLVTQ